MKKPTFLILAVLLAATVVLSACADKKAESGAAYKAETVSAAEKETANPVPEGYRQISQDEAQKLMQTEKDYIILDVRTPEEYAEGHIPGAICISHDSIPTDTIPELPDKAQLIMIYCRSGRRSKLAAEQLVSQGYTNIVEFGGVNTWQGELTKD